MKKLGGILLLLIFILFSFEAMAKSSQRAEQVKNPKIIEFNSESSLIEESSFIEFDRIYVSNSCSKTIWVALHYFSLDKKWKTISWFRLEPGEKSFMARTKNRMFYIHAVSSDATQVWKGEDSHFKVNGLSKPVGFKGYRVTSDSWGAWGHILTCR